jgi:hypothetical protein
MSDVGTKVGAASHAPAQVPPIAFEPALLEDPSIPQSFITADKAMVDGLREHLRRHGSHQSLRTTLGRLEDPVWLSAWSDALEAAAGKKVLFRGSELGILALRTLESSATSAVIAEPTPIEARIAGGVVQKHYLREWHALHGETIRSWSAEQRRSSFEAFAEKVDLPHPNGDGLSNAHCECLVFPNIDHSLLGTGIVKAVRQYREHALVPGALVLPGAARVFATAVQWAYPGAPFTLDSVNELRWSFAPQPLNLSPESWVELTQATVAGDVDFGQFCETEWRLELPVVRDGFVHGIVFWFDLTRGGVKLSNAPGSDLRCIKPAVQYTDPIPARAGSALSVRVRVQDTRLHFEVSSAPPRRPRHCLLPTWYVPMLQDAARNQAYAHAIDAAVKSVPEGIVLDIGSGCGLLSMMAARSGASRVIGCEVSPQIACIAETVVAENGFAERVQCLNKDCRNLVVGKDIAKRADIALFELFDCSLIGEGVLHFLAYARENLLAADARYVPLSGRLRAMAIECRLETVLGFDVNLLNPYRYSSSFINVDADHLQWRALTDAFDVFSFDFRTASPQPQQESRRVPVVRNGTVGAVLFWFDLQTEEGRWLSNAPDARSTLHWKQGLQWLPEVQVDMQMQLPLVMAHDGSGLRFFWDSEALPKTATSRLPRFDPHWRAQCVELERQTHGILEQCRGHPSEYAKLAQLAQRFAIDPGAHDLDPVIAHRFGATFFAP